MNNFELNKINRSIWLAYLDEENIRESFICYKNYIQDLYKLNMNIDEVNAEIQLSKKLFRDKLISLAEKNFAEKKYSKSIIAYNIAFVNDNKDEYSIKKFIECLKILNYNDIACTLLQYFNEIKEGSIENYKFLYEYYEKCNLYNEAIEAMEKYIALKEKSGENIVEIANDYNNLGLLYDKFNNFKPNIDTIRKSFEAFKKASQTVPISKLYARNTAVLAEKASDLKSAGEYWKKVIQISQLKGCEEMTSYDKYGYSLYSLKTGNFQDWYKYYDARFEKKDAVYIPKIEKEKRYDGKIDISQSTLLVIYEQGFGDTFMMWGYMPRLVKLAKNIVWIVQGELIDLLRNNEWGIKLYSRDYIYITPEKNRLNEIDFDYYIPSMSIPAVLNLNRNNISVKGGYIKVNDNLTKEFKTKYFNNNKFKIGISFAGAKNRDTTRDIKIKEFLPLDDIENIQIYNFTKDVEDNAFDILRNHKVVNIAKDFKNFSDTAAALKNCDIVLTSDNCILNLAGAIGIKTFALFNKVNDYRWFDLQGSNVVWYDNVKPYVCKDLNDWQSAVIPAVNDIKLLANC